jgi:hypothetical protein
MADLPAIQGVQIQNYEATTAQPLYFGGGPVCAVCSKPYRHRLPDGTLETAAGKCECPPKTLLPGDDSDQRPGDRQATALEMIAVYLGKLVKHVEASRELPSVTRAIEPAELPMGAVNFLPSEGAVEMKLVPPDAEKLAENQKKQQAAIDRLKGAK